MNHKKYLPVIIALLIPLIIGILLLVKPGSTTDNSSYMPLSPTNTPTPTTGPQKVTKDGMKYSVLIKTDSGNITIDLNPSETPNAVNNFVYLSQKGIYDNTIFHRVINGFMIQGGDPKGDGTGGPGYEFADEPFTGEYTRGTVAMANRGPNTNGSQFFIMHKDNPLPKNYVIVGKVVKGIEVVDKIATSPVKSNMFGENSTPVTPVKILNAQVFETPVSK